MSLKAKVEAIVYAAEEPVTLAQLAGALSNEVLEELAAAATPEGTEPGLWQEPGEPDPSQLEPSDADQASAPAGGDFLELSQAEPAQAVASEEGADSKAQEKEAKEDKEAKDEKKEARLRERRVRQRLESVLKELIADYSDGQRGIEVREIAGGYRMATKPEYHDSVRGFVKSLKPPMKLSLQALETLAVVAYKQPVTAPEVGEIRGVDSSGVLGSLIARKLITTAGRKHVIGRPILYKTTREFLLRFGLKDLNELPSVEEFEKMAGELAQAEAEAEDAAMRTSDDLPSDRDEEDPQDPHNLDDEIVRSVAVETAAESTRGPSSSGATQESSESSAGADADENPQ